MGGPTGTARRREQQTGEAGASGGDREKLGTVSRACAAVPGVL